MNKEKQLTAHALFWADHDEAGQRARIVAQDNLRRLVPHLFDNVVFLVARSDDDAA